MQRTGSLATTTPEDLAKLEAFLFEKVGPHFQHTGQIASEDFWLILVWKANRAKGFARWRMEQETGKPWPEIVADIALGIRSANSDEARLQLLMGSPWKFRLPTASAVLTVLYPTRFSVYDFRACDTLAADGLGAHTGLDWPHTDKTWGKYRKFVDAVRAAGPSDASLREKDHYLWGKSLLMSVQRELAGKAKPPKPRKSTSGETTSEAGSKHRSLSGRGASKAQA